MSNFLLLILRYHHNYLGDAGHITSLDYLFKILKEHNVKYNNKNIILIQKWMN